MVEFIKYILFLKDDRILILPILKYEKGIINYVLQWGWIVKYFFYCPNPYYKPILKDFEEYCIYNSVYGCSKIEKNEDPFNTESVEKENCTNILLMKDNKDSKYVFKKIDIYMNSDNFLTLKKTNQKHFVLNVFDDNILENIKSIELDNLRNIMYISSKHVDKSSKGKSKKVNTSKKISKEILNNIGIINIILIIVLIIYFFIPKN